MQSYSRRHFLRASAAAMAGAAVLGRGSSLVGHAAFAGAGTAATLTYTNRWGKGNDTHYAGMNYLFSTFKAKHPEITIKEIVLPAGPDVQKDLADCQAGGCPDVMNDMDGTFWRDGYLLDLTPYLNADPAWKASFDQQGLASTRSNGHQWGLCNELSPLNLTWNLKVLDAAKVSAPPKTWNELLAVCDKIKSSGRTPVSWLGLWSGSLMFHNLVAGQPGGLEALATNKFDAPQILEAFKALKLFVDNKWLAPNEIEATYGQGIASFQNDRTGFFMDGIWTIKNNITVAGAPAGLRNHVAFSALPALKGGGTVVENRAATIFGLSAGLKINPAKLHAAVTFMKYFFSEPVAAKWIPLTWSPMGVQVPLTAIPNLDPLPKAWLTVRAHATKVFSLPGTPAMQDQVATDCFSGLQTLLLGKSAEAAQAAFVKYLSKYMKA